MERMAQEKIKEYEAFINETLKDDLALLEARLDLKTSEAAEFIQLKTFINTIKNLHLDVDGFKTKVDVGNSIFLQAHVEDASSLLLDVGLGYFVDFTLDEALVVIDIRIKLLEKQIEHLRKQVAKTNSYIKVTLLALQELQGLNTPVPASRRVIDL